MSIVTYGRTMDKKVVIIESKWDRGRDTDVCLDGPEGMCCLGFLGLACGVKGTDLIGVHFPSKCLPESRRKYPSALFGSGWQTVFTEINDAPDIDDEMRKAWIKEGFKQVLGFDTEFVK